jgi:ABC-type glycerol-3-phosphate transport system substrate-binding protein
MPKRTFFLFFVVISALLGVVSTQAQEQPILLVIVPQFWENLVEDSDALVANFEAQYSVDVQIEYSNNGLGDGPTDADAVADYSEDLLGYLQLGDLVYAEESWLTPEVTRPGFVMDLMPLINADMNLNPNDFYPTVWQSFQWDGGMWALPTSADTLFVDYVPASFEEAGIAFPGVNWTMDDFAFAVRELTTYDDKDNVELPGAQVSNQARASLFYAFLGHGFYDSSAFPDRPALNSSDLAYIIEVWNDLLDEGVVVAGGGGFGDAFNDIPIRIGGGGRINITIATDDGNGDTVGPPGGFNFAGDAPERALAPLPNGLAVLQSNGFAISSGTQNPQLAYELTRYLSEQLAVANADVASEPARISYFADVAASNFITVNVERSPEALALIEDALYNGVPTSELRFSRYLNNAMSRVRGGTDGVSALQEAELDALATVDAMVNLDVNITVATPLVLTVAEDQILLDFEIAGFGGSLPNQAEWDALAEGFAAQDPEVGAVNIDQMSPRQLIFGSFECAYYPSTLFVSINPETMLALDPLLFSDMNYNVNDLPAGVLELVQVNGLTYGLPMTVQPLMLNYNPDMFAQAGIPEPIGGWTISEFANALELLQSVVEEDDPSFSPQGNTTAAILMLILAQGGTPIVFTTDPPTLDFTSPETVAAAQNVLDWARDGYIEYSGTGGFGGGGGGPGGGGFAQNNIVPIGASFFAGLGIPEANKITTYPIGANTPVALDVGAGYISKEMAYPEACYRWMSFIATRPYIFTGAMPALLPLLHDPVVIGSLGSEAVAAYEQIADMLNDPSVLSVNTGDPFIITWLSRAFDAYVLEDADLLTELELAEQYTRDYLACIAELDENPTLFALIDLQGCVETVDSAVSQ